MKLDLEALSALDAVVRHGSFARAAEALHKVTSAVSYQVKKLEEQLNLTLVDRSAYRVRLTAEGEAVLAEGRRLLRQAYQVEALAQQLASGWEARLLVVVDGILPLANTLRALKQLVDEGVPTRVQLKIEFLGGVQHRFEKEQADLMLVKEYQPSALLQAQAKAEVECVLCVAPEHALAQLAAEAGRPLRLEELQDHVELSVQDSSDQGSDRQMFGGERVFYLSGFVAKRQALLMGMGFGWMPRYLVDEPLAAGQLVELPYQGGSRFRFTPWLVQRLDRPPGRAGQRLIELLSRAA
ncbi:LysR family transcriptional regulator [Paucibacter sp. DJ2R-2]|uniref:LysR family transcriptional regulator n=1 Tax=Paucibacter sp. DJ2R-2 TaxID=2893558 RepID=UPI0021E3F332|nr:LysR family transcriptional regulator [Paucibacter sp. DJ2R-2]MCV2419305.1 LysR family transcriptional regulator [Paucibacter sp. DJ4R-1]MCV2437791.1 LysR family transcriptional regulator [Paucibacter sp. DJ2R-2]